MRLRGLSLLVLVCIVVAFPGCESSTGKDQDKRDPHVVPNKEDYEENPKFISPPTLAHPIYECSRNVTIKDFVKDATLNIFVNGAPAPNPTVVGQIPELGVNFDVGLDFVAGMVVHVTQTVGPVTSGPSNSVPVTSHTEDYPAGLPRPRLWKHPLFKCGHAILAEDVVPGSKVEITAENPDGMGGFKPGVVVGSLMASTEWGWNWSGVSPEFELGARITARASLCMDVSDPSEAEITEPAPSPMPAGSIEPPVIEGQEIVHIWGPTTGDPPQHGAILSVLGSGAPLGSTPTPGGAPHLFGIPAATLGTSYSATQKLCEETPPGTGPGTPTQPCSDLPAPKIKPPLPGDTKIYVTEHIPGANIVVFAGAEEIGDSSGNVINLSRPINNGEIIKVMQKLGKCVSPFRYEIAVACDGDPDKACSGDWPAFRHNGLRNARQIAASPLGDPYAVKTLKVKKDIASPDGGSFTASPVIFNDKIYIGTSNGRLFAFDAMTLAQIWQFPPAGDPALLSDYNTMASCANPSSAGIAASVAIAQLKEGPAVILAAPDKGRPSDPGGKFGSGLGSGRLFALNPNTGAVIWMTREEIARMTGTTANSTSQFHEQIGYSSPLVLGGRIYVGVANHCDNPIQNGRVVAVEAETGAVIGGFSFNATSTRGGGVWTFVSGGLGDALVTTTGNTRNGNGPTEPADNHGLSMVRLNPGSGVLEGKIQPVPYALDDDPDWSAGATLVAAACGNVSVSTMKDGWSYGANLGPPLTFRWQYPWVAFPFPGTDPNDHGDIRYHRAGAAWNGLYFTMTGGEDIIDVADPLETFAGYQRLHALNVCSGGVSWIADLAPFTNTVTSTHSWALGPPTVTHGIVYVGTNRGFLVAVADPSVWPAMGSRCTESHFTGADCIANGYAIVPQPAILKSMNLSAGRIVRTEPAIANGNLYVATEDGRLFRIAPEASP